MLQSSQTHKNVLGSGSCWLIIFVILQISGCARNSPTKGLGTGGRPSGGGVIQLEKSIVSSFENKLAKKLTSKKATQ